MHKRVIRGKIFSERWMMQNGLERMLDLIKRQKWERLFAKRDLIFKAECREFYKNLSVSISWKKEVAKSKVNGVEIKFDGMTLATILEIPGNNGLCDYIKEVWEPSRYCNPLEIIRKFINNENILEARRVKSVEMKPFHRFLQIFVMKNLVPRFSKRDVTSFMDLTYMDYLLTRRKINLPRVIIRHMAYVINMPNHELPYGELLTIIFEAFHVSLNYKKGEDPKRYDYFKETFHTMCQLKRENGIWWLGSGENRRGYDEEEAPADNVKNEEHANEGQKNQEDFEWEAVNEEAEIQGESGSDDKFYDAEIGVEEPADEVLVVPAFSASPADSANVQQKETAAAGVDPSDENDDDVVDLASQEIVDVAGQDDENQADKQDDAKQDDEHDVEEANVDTNRAVDGGDEDDDENNIPLSSSVEALRKGDTVDDDNVPLSQKYHAPPQILISVDTNLEVAGAFTEEMEVEIVGSNPAEMEVEVEVEDNSLLVVGDDGEMYGIDDVDALIDFVIEKTVDDILEDTNDKIDMEMAKE
ncbi:hypothetical protein Dimus_003269, partial [Dionaea muscipula]